MDAAEKTAESLDLATIALCRCVARGERPVMVAGRTGRIAHLRCVRCKARREVSLTIGAARTVTDWLSWWRAWGAK